MTTHRFVEQSPYYYSQMETYGFAHATLEDRYLMNDCNKLRAYFNKLFDDMYETKKREMSVIRERNEKIRHIDSELRTMFGQTVPQVPIDPQLHFKVNTGRDRLKNVVYIFKLAAIIDLTYQEIKYTIGIFRANVSIRKKRRASSRCSIVRSRRNRT